MTEPSPIRRTETVALFLNEDLARIAELAEVASSAINSAGPRAMSEGDPVTDAAREYDEFVTEATDRARKVTLQALQRKQWRSLRAAHPVRMETVKEKGEDGADVVSERPNTEDEALGFDVDAMADSLVPASIAPNQFDTPADRDQFLEDLSDPDFSRLYSAAVRLNTLGSSVPKANLSSRLAQIIGETSNSLDLSD